MTFDDGSVEVHTAIPEWVYDRETELVTCPVCGLVVFEENAGRICPHNGCYVYEAGGWK